MFGALRKAVFGPTIPRELLNKLQNSFTPDIATMELREFQLMFICDDMMESHRSSVLLPSCKLIDAYTLDPYILMKKDLGKATYPVLFNPRDTDFPKAGTMSRPTPAPVRGEVYAVRPWKVEQLDTMKENGVIFHRRRILLDIPHTWIYRDGTKSQLIHYKKLWAWTYFGDVNYHNWAHFADRSFKPVKPFTPRSNPKGLYYYYTKLEDVK